MSDKKKAFELVLAVQLHGAFRVELQENGPPIVTLLNDEIQFQKLGSVYVSPSGAPDHENKIAAAVALHAMMRAAAHNAGETLQDAESAGQSTQPKASA